MHKCPRVYETIFYLSKQWLVTALLASNGCREKACLCTCIKLRDSLMKWLFYWFRGAPSMPLQYVPN